MSSIYTLFGIVTLCLLLNSVIGDDPHGPPQNRFFLPRITTTTCDYATQPGLSCASCNQVLLCNSNNVGLLRTCGFIKKYCNNGRCSFFPGSACDATTTDGPNTTNSDNTTEGTTTNPETSTTGGG